MAYCIQNFKTKKAMKSAFAEGREISVYQPGPFGPAVQDGETTVEGPHYPAPHSWYARVQVQGGRIVRIIG